MLTYQGQVMACFFKNSTNVKVGGSSHHVLQSKWGTLHSGITSVGVTAINKRKNF